MKKKGRIIFRSGEKVIIRPVMRKDIGKFLVWMNDEKITQFLSKSMPLYEKEEEEWIEKLHTHKQTDLVFAVETKKGDFIGAVSLHNIIWKDRTTSIGISIGDKRYWNRGYGTDTLNLILDYAFNTLNLRKACLSVFNFNKRAFYCYSKCGFHVEGRRRKQYFKDGHYFDEIMMAVFKRDWLNSRKKK